MTKTVVVLGMHRSGTSAVAGMLTKLGVNMGENLYPPDHGNPLGHYEDVDFMDANTAILRAAGGEWHNPPSDFQIRVFGAREGQRVIDLINDRNAKHQIWGFKDPRTCLTLPLYLPHLPNAHFIIIKRDCHEIARSLHARDGVSFHHEQDNVTLCREYRTRVERSLGGYAIKNRFDINFTDVLKDPYRIAKQICVFLGISASDEMLSEASGTISN